MQQIFGLLMVICGVITCFGLITAIIGVAAIMAGVKLFQLGSCLNLACRS
ncbi:hypothetical protein J3U68_09465 [Snodgrassella sp. B3882]|nr:hypothetical protein [Snodgrassella sp. B3882]